MKYLIDGNYQQDALLKLVLGFSLAFTACLWLSNALIYIEKMGFTYQGVVNYYLGEGEFANPVSYRGLLEVTHIHLFVYGLYLLLINHLMLFTGLSGRVKFILILVSFVSGILNLSAGWLVRFLSPAFAYIKMGSFWIFQFSTVLIIILAFVSFKNGACSQKKSKRAN